MPCRLHRGMHGRVEHEQTTLIQVSWRLISHFTHSCIIMLPCKDLPLTPSSHLRSPSVL